MPIVEFKSDLLNKLTQAAVALQTIEAGGTKSGYIYSPTTGQITPTTATVNPIPQNQDVPLNTLSDIANLITIQPTETAAQTTNTNASTQNENAQDYSGAGWQIPEIITDPWMLTGFQLVGDFWASLLGTTEQKVEALKDVTGKAGINIDQPLEDVAEILKQQLGDQYGSQNILVNPITGTGTEIDLPQLPDIGKWLLIGGGVLAGVYLLGKVLGRKR